MAAERPEVMDADEVAAWLRVKRSTVLAMSREGRLPSIKVGRHTRFLQADLAAWISEQRNGKAA